MMTERVGIVGLGTIGRAVALNVRRAGYPVYVYDVRPEAVAAMIEEGIRGCSSPCDVASRADVVIIAVPDSDDVKSVILGSGGIVEGAGPGLRIIQMSTIDVDTTRGLARDVAKHGVGMIAALFCRSSWHVAEGKAMILLGGGDNDIEKCMPLLRNLADTFYECGDQACAMAMKLINNALCQEIAMAVCECLTLGIKAGLTLMQMTEVMKGTSASNKVMEELYPSSAFSGDFRTRFSLDLAHKDVGHALALASSVGSACPGLAIVHQMQNVARGQDKGRMDHSVLLTVFEELNEVEVRSPEGRLSSDHNQPCAESHQC